MSWSSETLEWIDIELTSFCNIKCKGCFRVISKEADKILNKSYIDIDVIRKRFQKEMFPSIKIINFCGSVDEPCSHPQFFEIIKHFADWDCHINIATNGSLRTVKWWTELASILPRSHKVVWGIDGSDELSEEYREGSSFKKVQQNYRAFIAAGGRANWQFISFEHNEHQLETARQIAKDEGFIEFKTIISHRKDSGGVKHKKVKAQESPCISCKYSNQKRIFVNHMGNVIPCCHLNSKMLEFAVNPKPKDRFEEILVEEDYMNDINLANVSLDEAMNGKVWTEIQNSWTSDDRISKCVSTCKENNRDKFIKETL
jgi:MoaA/NifB/PqqE/SkfB family radical SAM enzyme|tara:strand:- start:798 stop:1742 length:945 start_codon:yes stop_codon:yes gene_type:complete